MIGTTIDEEYQIEALIGRGAFGTVYRAKQKSLGRDVALKVLSSEDAGPKELERFLSEARLLAALNHPNVVQIYGLGSYQTKPYLVMELLSGHTLKVVVEAPVSLQRTLEIMIQVARGLQAIHSLGIVHRDLSTKNIMVGPSSVKILDLGLAKDLNRMSQESQEQYIVGTVGYIAPEQVESKGASAAADIFAFGVILYEALSGKHPFQAEHYMSMLYNIVHREPEPISKYVRNVPAGLTDLIQQCLHKTPDERPGSIQAVERSLAVILASTESSTTIERLELLALPKEGRASRNFYLNRTMIRKKSDYFGRTQEVRRIYSRLNATPPGSVSIVGDRKIGKSSLLNFVYMKQNRLEHLDEPEKTIMVFMDLREHKDLRIESFVGVLLSMATLELRGRVDVAGCGNDLDGVRILVERMDAAKLRLVILLDEFEKITGNENFGIEFFSFLRFLANHYNVSYLTSAARDLQSLCHNQQISDSPFFNIFSTMRLTVFKAEEARQLVCKPSGTAGRPLEPYADQLIGTAGLFPFFLQMACSHAMEAMEEHQGEPPDMQEVQRRFYEEARFFYRHMWDGFDPYERSLLRRVAGKKSVPDALKHVQEELEARHYVEPSNSGARLFASTFEQFVRTEATEKRSLLSRWFRSSGS